MPLYDFKCETCGIFEQWRTIAEASNPVICPACQATAQRIFSPPNINLSSGTLRVRGMESQEPQLMKRSEKEAAQPTYQAHQHGRPWMISH